MQVKSIAECSKGKHSAILSTFIKLPFVIKISVLSVFEWLFYTGFTVFSICKMFFKSGKFLIVFDKTDGLNAINPLSVVAKVLKCF